MAVMPNEAEAPASSPAGPAVRPGAGVARILGAAVALVLVAVPSALTLELVEHGWSPLLRADRGVRDSLNGYAVAHPGFVEVMRLISDAGSAPVWTGVLAVVVGWLLWRRLPRLALFVVVTAVGSAMLNAAIKSGVHRLRPVLAHPVAQEQGLSFPSGHAQAAMVGYAVLLIIFVPMLHGAWRWIVVAGAGVAVLSIGFSRLALGVHYASDVAGGFAVGTAWVIVMAVVFNVLTVDRQGRVRATPRRPAADSQRPDGPAGP
jgi:membrane-associated phospholipid phosphatase